MNYLRKNTLIKMLKATEGNPIVLLARTPEMSHQALDADLVYIVEGIVDDFDSDDSDDVSFYDMDEIDNDEDSQISWDKNNKKAVTIYID